MSKKTEAVLSLKQKIKNIHHFFFSISVVSLSLSPSVFFFVESHTQKYKKIKIISFHFIQIEKSKPYFLIVPVLLTTTIFFSHALAHASNHCLFLIPIFWSILHTHTRGGCFEFRRRRRRQQKKWLRRRTKRRMWISSMRISVAPIWTAMAKSAAPKPSPSFKAPVCPSKFLLRSLSLSLSLSLFVYVIWYWVGSDWFENFDVF